MKNNVTIVGMIYRSVQYLDFMMTNIRKYCLKSTQYNVDYLIVANDPTSAVLDKLKNDNINYILRIDDNPDDYYINRIYRGWNFGGFNADGDIIIFVNSDDGMSPNWMENLLKHLNKDTIPCSRLIESNKMPSGKHGMKAEFGRCPREFKEKDWLDYVSTHSMDKILDGGLYMPCAIYKQDFIDVGGMPEGNIYTGGIGMHKTVMLMAGDDWFFHHHPDMKQKRHITVCDSLIYHIIEGEKDE